MVGRVAEWMKALVLKTSEGVSPPWVLRRRRIRLWRRIPSTIYYMVAYTYILWSRRLKKRYVGSCHDLKKRLDEHNRGRQRFTKGGMPWELVYREEYSNYSLARKRELFLKTGQGRKYLDDIFRRGAGVDERDGLENR